MSHKYFINTNLDVQTVPTVCGMKVGDFNHSKETQEKVRCKEPRGNKCVQIAGHVRQVWGLVEGVNSKFKVGFYFLLLNLLPVRVTLSYSKITLIL